MILYRALLSPDSSRRGEGRSPQSPGGWESSCSAVQAARRLRASYIFRSFAESTPETAASSRPTPPSSGTATSTWSTFPSAERLFPNLSPNPTSFKSPIDAVTARVGAPGAPDVGKHRPAHVEQPERVPVREEALLSGEHPPAFAGLIAQWGSRAARCRRPAGADGPGRASTPHRQRRRRTAVADPTA